MEEFSNEVEFRNFIIAYLQLCLDESDRWYKLGYKLLVKSPTSAIQKYFDNNVGRYAEFLREIFRMSEIHLVVRASIAGAFLKELVYQKEEG